MSCWLHADACCSSWPHPYALCLASGRSRFPSLCSPDTGAHTAACRMSRPPRLVEVMLLLLAPPPVFVLPGHRYRALNVQAGTQFCDGGFEGEVAAGRISSSSLDKYSCVALAGVLARWVICGVKQQCRARNKPNSGPVCVGRSKSKSGLCVWRLSRAACDWHGWCQPDGGCSCGELTLHVE